MRVSTLMCVTGTQRECVKVCVLNQTEYTVYGHGYQFTDLSASEVVAFNNIGQSTSLLAANYMVDKPP